MTGPERADPRAYDDGPVVVEIEDVCGPAVFGRLPDALTALGRSLRLLPLGTLQAGAFTYFLAHPDAGRLVAESIRRDGRLALSFRLDGRLHSVWISPAGAPPPPR